MITTNLDRFVLAQEPLYDQVVSELRAGRKRSHWMWFIFPQLQNLGQSPNAHLYGITDLAEAQKYLAHPILGERLRECSTILASHKNLPIWEIFGWTDARKLHSSMTLFNLANGTENNLFKQLVDQYYDGLLDEATLRLLSIPTIKGD